MLVGGILRKRSLYTGQNNGFTIVELLIVIVVIAILAAITIVAYTGIQSRADDSAVQANLREVGQRVEQFKIENQDVPPNGSDWESMNIALSRNSYSRGFYNGSGWYNVAFCRNNERFALFAEAKSGNTYKYVSGEGLGTRSSLTGSATMCSAEGIASSSSGYEVRWAYNDDIWTSMTQ